MIPTAQSVTPIVDTLRACAEKPHAPFYTPGHKRGRGTPTDLLHLLGASVFQADLPELPELDNLFAPQAVIQQAQELAAEAFGAEHTWFLVNGSTCGIVAAMLATCAPGDKIVLPRNVHQSAIAGLILSGAVPIFLTPEYDAELEIAHSITPDAVATALQQHPDTKAVIMVYPTYYGVCGDIAQIVAIAHQHQIPLLVDEAHGPHFAFHADLPQSALAAGADLVVQSTHKVLSALTQAAMLHCQGSLIDPDRVSQALQLTQSTSPSYLLLASLDAARQQMATQGQQLMTRTLQLADLARSQINQIPGLTTLDLQAKSPGFAALDRTRLTVTVSRLGIDGFTADEILHQQFCVTAELPSLRHLTFIISLGTAAQDIEQLVTALNQLAAMHQANATSPESQDSDVQDSNSSPARSPHLCTSTLAACSPRDAFFAATHSISTEAAIGRISAELVCPYPPGIPVLLPGERITQEAIVYLQQILALGGIVSGCADPTLQTLKVVN